MKKLFAIALAFILLVSTAVIVQSAATVIINPSAPTNHDNLVCSVAGNTGDFDFYWYMNGQEFRVDYGASSTISASDTNPGDNWKCAVYTPMANKVGEAEVTIPSVSSNVRISPQNPLDSDTLSCSVLGSTSTYDYVWYQNGVQFKTENGLTSTVSALDTNAGDSWRCAVTGEGEDTVQIDANSAGGFVAISPSNPDTTDTLTGEVYNLDGDYEFRWYRNGNAFRTDIGESSEINPSDTTKGQIWRLEVYTPLYDSYVGEASVMIGNAAPEITSVSAPDTAKTGSIVSISFTAEDADGDSISYFILKGDSLVSATNSYTWSAEDGNTVFTLYATDGEGWDYETFTIGGDKRAGSEVSIYALNIASIVAGDGEYLKIKNNAHSIDGVTLRVSSLDTNEVDYFNLNMPRNSVKLIPLGFDLKENNSYLLRVDVMSDDFTGKNYLIVEK